jgi:C4-type Zn-finger protein
MSKANQAGIQIGCPSCDRRLRAAIPATQEIEGVPTADTDRLQGTDLACENCGHELSVYFY